MEGSAAPVSWALGSRWCLSRRVYPQCPIQWHTSHFTGGELWMDEQNPVPHPSSPPRQAPSLLGTADQGGGRVGVGAEQGGNGVVAEARVIGCEHHLQGTQTGSISSRAPNHESFRDCGKSRPKKLFLFSCFLKQWVQKAKFQIYWPTKLSEPCTALSIRFFTPHPHPYT